MSTPATSKELFASLKLPFPSSDVEWRTGQTNKDRTRGRALPYLKFKAVADRLDQIIGEADWKAEYVAGPAGGVVCKLSLRINGEWICKENGAGNTELEGIKGGLTDAFKRAATMWGVGRYLHDYDAIWVDLDAGTGRLVQIPALPDNLLPPEEVEANRKAAEAAAAESEKIAAAAAVAAEAGQSTGTVAAVSKPAKPDVVKETKVAAESKVDATAATAEAAKTEEPSVEKAPAETTTEAVSTTAAAEEEAVVAATNTSAANDTTNAVGEDGVPVMPEGLPVAQVKRIEQLVERIAKGVPLDVIRDYVNGKGKESMMEVARSYVLACLDHKAKEKALAEAA